MKIIVALAFVVSGFLSVAGYSKSPDLTVHTYASQPRFHDSVNTHWIETKDAVVIIDVQRLFSESRQAIRHIKSLEKPIKAIFITHAHSDHYGGLPIFRQAFPNTPVFTNKTTLNSIKTDGRGYTKARKQQLGDDFPSQQQMLTALPDQLVEDGDVIDIDGTKIRVDIVAAGEAEEGIVLYLPEQGILFAGDNLNNGFVPAPLESLDGWLRTLDAWQEKYSGDALVYPGHGRKGRFTELLASQYAYLKLIRKKVKMAINDNAITSAQVDQIALEIEREFPHSHGVGGNSRFNVIKFVVEHVARQYGAIPEKETQFR